MIIRFYRKTHALSAHSFEIKFIQRNMMQFFVTSEFKKTHVLLPYFMLGKIKQYYFLFESQFTSFGQILFNLYKFQMVEDFLGHPVYVLLCSILELFYSQCLQSCTQVYFTTKWHCIISHATLCFHMFTSIFLLVLFKNKIQVAFLFI